MGSGRASRPHCPVAHPYLNHNPYGLALPIWVAVPAHPHEALAPAAITCLPWFELSGVGLSPRTMSLRTTSLRTTAPGGSTGRGGAVPRPERPLDAADGVLAEFAAELRRLREKAGSPAYRVLAQRAHYSVTTLSDAAGGRRFPTLAVTMAYVAACDGDTAEWETRWTNSRRRIGR